MVEKSSRDIIGGDVLILYSNITCGEAGTGLQTHS